MEDGTTDSLGRDHCLIMNAIMVAPPSMAALFRKNRMHKHLPQRWDFEDSWYFVTVVTQDRCPYFANKEYCEILLDACRSVREKHPFRLGALVILPDHWHGLIRPEEKQVVEGVVGGVKQRVYHESRKHDGKAVYWQARFMDHRIRDEADYFQHLEYMRLNPRKHELMPDDKAEWPWWFVHQNPFG
jgi:putative transposase